MYKFIQRNQKKMLAVFGVLLMIVFVLPNTLGQGGSDPVEGSLAGDGGKIRLSDKKQADAEVNALGRHGLLPMAFGLRSPFEVYQRPQIGQLAEAFREELEQHPELWVMLVREAEQAGIRPAPDQG